jgi:hypothetical protein
MMMLVIRLAWTHSEAAKIVSKAIGRMDLPFRYRFLPP